MSSSSANGPFVQPPAATQTEIAPQVSQRGTVMTLGLLLVVVNVFTSEAGVQLVGNLTGLPVSSLTQYTQSGTWVAPRDIALQLLLVLLLAGFAGINESTGSLALTLVAALWLLWILQHTGLWSGLLGTAPAAGLFSAGTSAGGALGKSHTTTTTTTSQPGGNTQTL